MSSAYSQSEAYKRFRGWVAQQKISVDNYSDKVWKFYDYGNKSETPLIFLPGVSGTAETYYMQFLSLCPKGYRVIAVQFPNYMNHEDFCKGFDRFLDKLSIDKVHLFGTSIGGYVAQCYTQYRPKRVLSLILCNTFSDTSYYAENAPCVPAFPYMPEFVLKRFVLANFPEKQMEAEIANSVDFMVEQMETLSQKEMASRLTLNCTQGNLKPAEWTIFDKSKITIIDCIDEVAVPPKLREEVYKYYPEAKIAELKTGGNFPYLSRSDEINMHIQVHLRRSSTQSENNQEDAHVEDEVPLKSNKQKSAEGKQEENENKKEVDPSQNQPSSKEETSP